MDLSQGANYPGQAPVGSVGIVTAGPTTANGYTWWDVNYGNGSYQGWSIGNDLENAVTSGRTLGIDVSSYQGSVNWSSIEANGDTFAFARATRGTILATTIPRS